MGSVPLHRLVFLAFLGLMAAGCASAPEGTGSREEPTKPRQEAKAEQRVEIPVGENRALTGTLYLPQKPDPSPAVVVLHTRYGSVERFDFAYARNLAREGYVALAVNYLHPSLRGQLWSLRITQDLVRVVDFLRSRPEVQGKPVGVVGFSLGSHGIRLAAAHPAVKAVAVYYGAYNRRKLPALRSFRGTLPPFPVDVAPQVNAAVLLLHGDADDETPLSQAEDMREALRTSGKTVELVVYAGAYHRFDRGPSDRMTGEKTREGYTYRHDPRAERDAWARTLAWFKTHLNP